MILLISKKNLLKWVTFLDNLQSKVSSSLESIHITHELLLDYITTVAEDLLILNKECNGSILIEVLPHIEKTRDKTIE
jgi:hypothetical protein